MKCLGIHCSIVLALSLIGCAVAGDAGARLPIRAIHFLVPSKAHAPLFEKFIAETLPREGVNCLILEFGYQYAFTSHPELGDPSALGRPEMEKIVAACRAAGIKLIPEFNCLGHQSWAKYTFPLLKLHPEFNESSSTPADNKGIYCRSWCPLHPDLHKYVFALMDELADVCQSDAVHVGMDEVFIIADGKCPRCAGQDPAELFAGEVKLLHDHLASKGKKMWMWGDRLLDAKAFGIGEWEASNNGTARAVDLISRDIVICDWHYDKSFQTARYFAEKGFAVLSCPYANADVGVEEVSLMEKLAADPKLGDRALGIIQTTWVPFKEFESAWRGEKPSPNAVKAADCFKKVFAALKNVK